MIHWLHGLVWGPGLLCLLLGTGLFLTWRSRLFQIRGFPVWWRATAGSLFRKKKGAAGTLSSGAVNPIQAACTALAATIGTGNIVGVATALTAGGPGAIFWMWISALLGMMTAYSETYLGIRYRKRREDGQWLGGPCACLSEGLGMPGLALLYGILCLLASLGMGSMVQSNAMAQTLHFTLNLPNLAAGILITLLVTGIAAGGIGRIAFVSQGLIPAAALVYTFFSAAVLWSCRERIPSVLAEIFRYALLPEAFAGGTAGYGISRAFRYGIARGVFSNEAGLGTLAGLHSATEETSPGEQGMWAMFEVFFDTVFICTLTALVILCAAGGAEGLERSACDGAALTGWCFQKVLGTAGQWLVSGAMLVFAFSTTIAWYFLGKQTLKAVLELAGKAFPRLRLWEERLELAYLFLYGYAVFLGCVCSLTAVWELSDIWNGLMAVPNLAALFLLRKELRFSGESG